MPAPKGDQPGNPTKKLVLLISCYNEAEAISSVITAVPVDQLRRLGVETSVCVIDNNSSDNTAELARAAGATVIHEPQPGKGNAMRTGFRSLPSDTDLVAMIDGDDTYDPTELLRMVEPLLSGFADVVIGSRLGGRIREGALNPVNRFGNWMFTFLTRVGYRANTTDVLTGYFAWKKPVIDQLHPVLVSAGFAIEMEMVTKMARMGWTITSVPISYHPRLGESSLHPVRDGARIWWMGTKNLTWRPTAGTDVSR